MSTTNNFKGFHGSLTELEDKPEERYQAVHHQFIASARAVKYAYEHFLHFKMGCMIGFLGYYPYTCNPDDVLATLRQKQMVDWFCSDVQVRFPFYRRNGKTLRNDLREQVRRRNRRSEP